MSIQTQKQIKRFKVGAILSRNFDNFDILDQNIGEHVNSISHVYSNAPMPGGKLLEDFCREHKLPLTIFPANPHTFSAISNVLDNSDFIYIITDGESKIAQTSEEFCKKDGKKYKIINYNPFVHWGKMIVDVKQIFSELSEEDINTNDHLKKIYNVIKK